MVKLESYFNARTTTLDSLKISLPKVRDDPFGSLSPRIASDCPGESDFRGSLDSPVITSPKTRVEPHGSVSARGCSDVQDRANFFPISWFSLGCSTDHNTAASMVIAHKVGCYTGKRSMYSWNSFILEDFSSVLVELIVPPEVIFAYGSLSRPPEKSWFASQSQRIYSDMLFRFLLPMLTISGDDIVAFWLSLAHRYAYREGELLLANLNQNHDSGDAGGMSLDILPAFCSISETDSSLDVASLDLFRESYVTQEQQLPQEDFISHTILQLFSAQVLPGRFFSPSILLQHSDVLQQPDIQVLFGSVGCKLACSAKELYLKCIQISGVNQLKHSELASHVSHL